MHSQFLIMCLFAFFVAVVFATLLKDDLRQQLRFGGLLFGGFVLAAVVIGWLMYPFPL